MSAERCGFLTRWGFVRSSLVVLFVAAIGAALLYVAPGFTARAAPERLVIATALQPHSALLFIAEERGYFAAEGLDVELRTFSYGRKALRAVLAGEADIGTVSDMPFVAATRAGEQLVAVATIESSDKQNFIIARKNRGIERPRDLIGKRVGFIPGTSSEVFLDAFLITQAIAEPTIDLIPHTPENIVAGLEDGSVDAVSVWALDALVLQQKLGRSNLQVLSETGLYVHDWILAARHNAATEKQSQLRKLLRALLRAEEYEAENPVASMAITARRLKLQPRLITAIWPNFNFNVGLHQYLVINLETHARMSARSEFEREQNFSASLMFEPLMAVDPTRITAIH